MFKKFCLSFVCLTIVLYLAVTDVSFAAQFKFPSKIQYGVFMNGKKIANSEFSCFSRRSRGSILMYQLSFGNFLGLDFTLRDKIYTIVFKDILSFSRTILVRGKEKIYEIKKKKTESIFGDEKTIFLYRDGTSLSNFIEEEYYHVGDILIDSSTTIIPLQHKVIDFLSLFLVVSESVASGNYNKHKKFHLFNNRAITVVKLKHIGRESLLYQGQNILTTVFILSYQGRDFVKLNIYHDNQGFYFPVQVIIKNKYDLIELKANKAF
jgi:hypothetical protein